MSVLRNLLLKYFGPWLQGPKWSYWSVGSLDSSRNTSSCISAKCSRKMNVVVAVSGSIIPVKVLVN